MARRDGHLFVVSITNVRVGVVHALRVTYEGEGGLNEEGARRARASSVMSFTRTMRFARPSVSGASPLRSVGSVAPCLKSRGRAPRHLGTFLRVVRFVTCILSGCFFRQPKRA